MVLRLKRKGKMYDIPGDGTPRKHKTLPSKVATGDLVRLLNERTPIATLLLCRERIQELLAHHEDGEIAAVSRKIERRRALEKQLKELDEELGA